MSDERRTPGVTRVNVHPDGTRDVEEVTPEHPVIGPLAALIEEQLGVEIIHGQLGVDFDQIDQEGLSRAAFSIAEEVDHYYTVTRRSRPMRRAEQD
jgi:hypothetical protein